MDNIPSKSISKSLLIATPLFLVIMAILNTSNEISYLFVLDFVNNVGGKADIMFIPTMQPEIHTDNLYRDLLLDENGGNGTKTPYNIPLVKMSNIKNWAKGKQLIKGVSARWLVPVLSNDEVDSLLMVMNISQELEIGFGLDSKLENLAQGQVAISQEFAHRLMLQEGSVFSVNLGIKNLFNGMKLFQKFQDLSSYDQYSSQAPQISIQNISKAIYNQLPPSSIYTEKQIQAVVSQLYNAQLSHKYKVKYIYKESGLFPSALHNVILMQYPTFSSLLTQFIKKNIISNKSLNITQFIPKDYQLIYELALNSGTYDQLLTDFLTVTLQQNCIVSLLLLNHREQIYHPDKRIFNNFTAVLQKSPDNVDLVALYPFYEQSLNMKYLFSSVVQIFEVVTCLIYLFTMSLIMKQIYEEKQIEVGIWRTLGAGGVKQRDELNADGRSALKTRLTLKEKGLYFYKILVKIGFIYYWLFSAIVSICIYMLIKQFMIRFFCELLHFEPIKQDIKSALVLFLVVIFTCEALSLNHINTIYTAPLALTIKPVKRTFDQVKIRIIHLATFGLSSDVLMIAVLLIYYGVVSYYWIPFSFLDNDRQLQTVLFNSIFVLMIFGSIVLITVVQSRFERVLLRLIFMGSQRLRKMKMIMLKNIKAKQYKNIKMSIIIAVTFAFLLFFSTGINIEIMIVESIVERAIGAELVIQNYEKHSFNQSQVQNYLNTLPEVRYSWISGDINSDGVEIDFINQMDPNRDVYCQVKVMTPNYLESSYYKYYYPQSYIEEDLPTYRLMDNGVYNGFDSLYRYDQKGNNQSIGRYDPNDTMPYFDPKGINVGNIPMFTKEINKMAPKEQVINFAASSLLKLQLGAKVGDYYKMQISGSDSRNFNLYHIRSRISHSYKIGPGMDALRPQAFITEDQAKYIYRILGRNQTIRYEKLLIQGPKDKLKGIGSKIIAMSPEHTQMIEMSIVSESFLLLQTYLKIYVLMISVIMGTLAVLFIFLYTLGKCRDQAEMYKMLRAVGLPVRDIRIMIFLEILIRLLVSIVNGILLGIVFSWGFSAQIQQFLMINTPGMDLTMIIWIAAIMFSVFCLTVYLATKYLTQRTVNNTNKI